MSSATVPDSHTVEAIARAERRRGMLERMAEIGMQLVEQVGAHAAAAGAAINEDKSGDPVRAFATASRAVRLTLAMEARLDRQIIALRNGRAPAPDYSASSVGAHRRRCVDFTAGATGDDDEGRRARGELRESLVDRESFGRLVSPPPRVPIAAAADDAPVGVQGRRWSHDGGFEELGPVEQADQARPRRFARRLE